MDKKVAFKLYKNCAYVILNTLLIFTALNLIAFYLNSKFEAEKKLSFAQADVAEIKSERLAGPLKVYGEKIFIKNPKIYGEGVGLDDIKQIMRDYYFNGFGLEYSPYIGYQEKKGFESKSINISEFGFRKINKQSPLLSEKKIVFVLGGSTTFGYGVRDDQTIPSYLQDILGEDYAIFNFGRGYYYSKQQLILLIQLINKGFIPDIVISIDGVNEKGEQDTPSKSILFEKALEWKPSVKPPHFLNSFPIIKYLNREFLDLDQTAIAEAVDTGVEEGYDYSEAERDVNYYLQTTKIFYAICNAFEIKYFAFVQPAHIYKFDYEKLHPFFKGDKQLVTRQRYDYINQIFLNSKNPEYMFSLLDLQENEDRQLYVDLVHYNPYFNKKIASSIAGFIRED